jgi:copper chaperone NosL
MLRRQLLVLCLAFWASCAVAQNLPKPGPKDLCPVCGMLVAKYPNWVATITWKDGHAHFFDGAKDMFKFLHDLAKYAPGHRKEDIAGIYVTDFYNLERIDARKAIFVTVQMSLGRWAMNWCRSPVRPMLMTFSRNTRGRKSFRLIG